ncbi:MAG: hypothetical protein D6685_00265, partial [Bacteroidetes bacterium]
MRRGVSTTVVVLAALLPGTAVARQSASCRMDEHVLNQGGRPADGVTASSASYRVSLGSLGESVTDSDPIAPGGGFFYLVTARNRLDEEGTKGRDSAGSERAGSA